MNWKDLIEVEQQKPYFKELMKKVNDARTNHIVYPDDVDIYNAFTLTPFNKVKVVIIGQDPYHQPNQAHGLAFSTLDTKTPKSLINIKKELLDDLDIPITPNNDLTNWAKEGVLLLNTILTVEQSKPLSHKGFGWEDFTLNLFKELTKVERPLVFILWGNHAKQYEKYIKNTNHLVLKAPHPSPLSSYRGFFGSKPFSKTNAYLTANNIPPINFKI